MARASLFLSLAIVALTQEAPRRVGTGVANELERAGDGNVEMIGDLLKGLVFQTIHAEGDLRALREFGDRIREKPQPVAMDDDILGRGGFVRDRVVGRQGGIGHRLASRAVQDVEREIARLTRR